MGSITPSVKTSVALALSALCSVGCGAGRADQCNALVGAISPHVPALNTAIEGLGDLKAKATVAEALSTALADTDRDVAALALTDDTLVGLAASYREQITATAALAKDLSTTDDTTKLQAVIVGTDTFVTRQGEILHDINAYCKAK